ncbi:MAG: hypothetical protein V4723_04915 [Pseudomonadota bacterium]
MNAEQRLFGLMALAEEQQKNADAAIAQLVAERHAMREERSEFTRQANTIKALSEHAILALEKAAGDAVARAMAHALTGTSEQAMSAIKSATQPLVSSMHGALHNVNAAELELRSIAQWLSWRWAAILAASAGGILVALWLLGMAAVEWQRHQLATLAAQRSELESEVAQLQENADAWSKRGGRAKLEQCGDNRRLCVRIVRDAAYGKSGDLFVLRGY